MATFTFSSSDSLSITSNAVATSTITTYGVSTFTIVNSVSVTLNGLQHTYPDDLDMLLVSPDLHNLVFWSDAGADADINGTYTITDSTPTALPDTTAITQSTYRPINHGADEVGTDFGSFVTVNHATGNGLDFYNAFNGSIAEGNWTLYVRDDAGGDSGSLFNWNLTIQTVSDTLHLDGTGGDDTILVLRTPTGTGAYQMNDLPAVTFTGVNGIYINAMDGNDVVYASASGEYITGGSGRDAIYAGGGDDILRVGTGDDVAGETYDGGSGTDTLRFAGVTGDFGNDTVLSIERVELGANKVIFDAAQIGPGLSLMATVAGVTDFVDPETMEVVELSDVFEVRLTTSSSVDLSSLTFVNFSGPLDQIRILGDGTAESITGTALNDIIDGGGNADTMRGLAGNDTYYVNAAGDGVVEAVGNGFDTVLTTVAFTLGGTQEIEVLKAADAGTTNAMNLNGNEFANQITGNAGVNVINGGGADDVLSALGGADVLVGGAGYDTMSGGAGADRFNFDSIADIGNALNARDVITDFENGSDRIDLDDIDALTTVGGLQHFTWLGTGGHTGAGATLRYQQVGGNTLIYGDVDANGSGDFSLQLNGLHNLTAASFTNATIARIQGGAGNDTLTGAPGGKTMAGLGGNDTITGGSGADTIIGGAGGDTLKGLGGADVFSYATVAESGTTTATRDIILDFQQGSDKVDLAAIDANTTVAGNQAFTWLGTAAHTGAGATLRYQQVGGNTLVYADVDANGSADFSIQLTGLYTLTATDFAL